MNEYTNLDMVKSLVRAIELLAEENKELRKEIRDLKTAPAMWFNSRNLGLPPVTDKEQANEVYNRETRPIYST